MDKSTEPFSFQTQISENNLSRAWLATRAVDHKKCFVKEPSTRGDLSVEEKSRILRRSYQLQARIRCSNILTATSLKKGSNRVYIEYPWLAQDTLGPLSLRKLLGGSSRFLRELGILVDYLHQLGLVHLDLKLDNFGLISTPRRDRLVMLDLDCLEESGCTPKHRLIGTPRYMAPEVKQDDCLNTHSDLYSLGCSLKDALHVDADEGPPAAEIETELRKLGQLADSLSQVKAYDRPDSLLRAMLDNGLVDESEYWDCLRTVLGMILFTSYRNLLREPQQDRDRIVEIVLRKANLYGLHEDIISALQFGYACSRLTAVRVMRDLITRSIPRLQGVYWRLESDDQLLLESLRTLLEGSKKPCAGSNVYKGRLLLTGKKNPNLSEQNGLYEYLVLSQHNDIPSRPAKIENSTPLEQLGDLAVGLSRFSEAAAWYEQALQGGVHEPKPKLDLYHKAIQQRIAAGEFQQAKDLLSAAIGRAAECESLSHLFEFRRLRAWFRSHGDEHSVARDQLRELAREASAASLWTVEAKALGDLAGILRSNGEFSEAETIYHKCFALVKLHGCESEIVATTYSYAQLCFQRSEYKRAIKYAKRSGKQLDPLRQSQLGPYIALTIAASHTRLGEYQKAEIWFTRCLSLIHKMPRAMSYVTYFSHLGWSYMVRGRLKDAHHTIHHALSLLGSSRSRCEEMFCYRNLTEIALYQGELGEFNDYVDQTLSCLATWPNNEIATELELLRQLERYLYHDSRHQCQKVIREILKQGGKIYAAIGLLVLMTDDDYDDRSLMEVAEDLSASGGPIFATLSHMVKGSDIECPAELRLPHLKKAYQLLEAAGLSFLALLVCRQIARLYFKGDNIRLANRFVKQALSLSVRLSNEPMQDALAQLMQGDKIEARTRNFLVRAIEGIAGIHSTLNEQDDPLQKILEFTADAVGAERGVLFYRSKVDDELRVKAQINCDDHSFNDIVNYSKNLPNSAVESNTPIYVADALTDHRTKKFKSIVAYNIRSVICVPFHTRRGASGVIYLDHHTIPALFDDTDLRLVKSLSQLASSIIETILDKDAIKAERDNLQVRMAQLGGANEFITRSRSGLSLLRQLEKLAISSTGVLLAGESGTGKEIIASLLHRLSPRAESSFVRLNCAAINESLVESELFGVAAKTATGVDARAGKFEAADGGTMFLDEIGDLPLPLQAKVLRVLEYQEFERVGSTKPIHTDIRFIYATNKDLPQMVNDGSFRQDLWYRIGGLELRVPPLRERPEDIAVLIDHFCGLFAPEGRSVLSFAPEALKVLESYSWPGNVRELRNLIERLIIIHSGATITVSNLPHDLVRVAQSSAQAKDKAEALEQIRIAEALSQNRWNQSAAARALSISLSSLRRRIKKYNITP